jgi:hypothetical protein
MGKGWGNFQSPKRGQFSVRQKGHFLGPIDLVKNGSPDAEDGRSGTSEKKNQEMCQISSKRILPGPQGRPQARDLLVKPHFLQLHNSPPIPDPFERSCNNCTRARLPRFPRCKDGKSSDSRDRQRHKSTWDFQESCRRNGGYLWN